MKSWSQDLYQGLTYCLSSKSKFYGEEEIAYGNPKKGTMPEKAKPFQRLLFFLRKKLESKLIGITCGDPFWGIMVDENHDFCKGCFLLYEKIRK